MEVTRKKVRDDPQLPAKALSYQKHLSENERPEGKGAVKPGKEKILRRYIGNAMTAYATTAITLFTVLPPIASIFILRSEISFATVFLSLMCVLCGVSGVYYICRQCSWLFAWCELDTRTVTVKSVFRTLFVMEYAKCADVGMSCYIHGVLNSTLGSRERFIYLSYNKIDEKYKSNINLMKPTKTCIKIGWSRKTYEYLKDALPPRQAAMLRASFERMQAERSRS